MGKVPAKTLALLGVPLSGEAIKIGDINVIILVAHRLLACTTPIILGLRKVHTVPEIGYIPKVNM